MESHSESESKSESTTGTTSGSEGRDVLPKKDFETKPHLGNYITI